MDVDVRCIASIEVRGVEFEDARCQLLSGHCGPHGLLAHQTDRVVWTWAAQSLPESRPAHLDSLTGVPWAPGQPMAVTSTGGPLSPMA